MSYDDETLKRDDVINEKKSIVRFFNDVYLTMGFAILVSFVTAYALFVFDLGNFLSMPVVLILFLLEIGLVVLISGKMRTMKYSILLMSLILFSFLNGLTLSTIFYVYELGSIIEIFGVVSIMFFALSIIGRVTKKDLSGFGKFLYTFLIGIIIASIINFFMNSESMQFVISIIGVGIFSGLIVYDNNKLSQMYKSSDVPLKNLSVYGALTLYLDFINLLLYLLRLLGKRK